MIGVDEARQYYQDNDSAHDFDHVLRVTALAECIGRTEGADMDVLRTAALLHDIGRAEERRSGGCHAEIGAERARTILSGESPEFAARVSDAILSHRFRVTRPPKTLEARVLYDADKLDAIGAIGVARAYAVAGQAGQSLWSPLRRSGGENGGHTPVVEFQMKLGRLKDSLFTVAGRALAQERHAFMVSFFERLEQEVKGER